MSSFSFLSSCPGDSSDCLHGSPGGQRTASPLPSTIWYYRVFKSTQKYKSGLESIRVSIANNHLALQSIQKYSEYSKVPRSTQKYKSMLEDIIVSIAINHPVSKSYPKYLKGEQVLILKDISRYQNNEHRQENRRSIEVNQPLLKLIWYIKGW